MANSMITCSLPGEVIWPRTRVPDAKAPSSLMPNQAPNCSASARARQTRARGARRTIFFSMRSVLVRLIGNLQVAWYPGRPVICNRLVAIGRRSAEDPGQLGGRGDLQLVVAAFG